MATIVVSIICIALVVLGGMTMSQGILTSADTTALSFEKMSIIESDLMRTEIDATRAARLSWADTLRLTVENSGQTKLADFDKWDVFAQYYDTSGTYHRKWLPCTDVAPEDNDWQAAALCLNGQPEVFEPGLLNAGEELLILADLTPPPAYGTSVNITVAACNGAQSPVSFTNYSYTMLNPHSENLSIAGTGYYELAEAAPSDGPAITETTDAFTKGETGRKLMHYENDASRPARHLFPLKGISQIPAAEWTVYYRCRTLGDPNFPNNENDVNFDIDILIRQAEGTLRTTIATGVADAYLSVDDAGVWVTRTGTFDFPGYTVVDDSDYLEIVYYGEVDSVGPPDSPGYMQIRIDDNTLDLSVQTRIET